MSEVVSISDLTAQYINDALRGTGKEQKITITSSTKLSEEEINKKVKEAEQYASEDKKRKEEIEVRNQAETLVYETEKNVKDLGDSLSADEKSKIEAAKDTLKKSLENGTVDEIKANTEALTEQFHTISEKMYQKAQAQQQAAGGAGAAGGAAPGANAGQQQGGGDDNVVDADFEVVDDDKKDE